MGPDRTSSVQVIGRAWCGGPLTIFDTLVQCCKSFETAPELTVQAWWDPALYSLGVTVSDAECAATCNRRPFVANALNPTSHCATVS